MPLAVTSDEGHPSPVDRADDQVIARVAEGRVHRMPFGVLEEGIEARAADHADAGKRLASGCRLRHGATLRPGRRAREARCQEPVDTADLLVVPVEEAAGALAAGALALVAPPPPPPLASPLPPASEPLVPLEPGAGGLVEEVLERESFR